MIFRRLISYSKIYQILALRSKHMTNRVENTFRDFYKRQQYEEFDVLAQLIYNYIFWSVPVYQSRRQSMILESTNPTVIPTSGKYFQMINIYNFYLCHDC